MRENYNKKLLVEGIDDLHVVSALCNKYSITENFDVIDCKGVDVLLERQLPLRFKQTDINTIGILIDADTDINNRWESTKNILIKEKFTVPNNIPTNGLIINNGKLKIGVWIMPDNELNGMLEDFIKFLIPQNDDLLPIAETILSDIETRKLNKYILAHTQKALIHTWLAWQETPGIPMGLSITKKYLNTDSGICLNFVNWLKELFQENE